MEPTALRLEQRFLENLARLGVGAAPERLLVALSGGCDSVALLHLLRFGAAELPLSLCAAHLDHAMRPGSAADARWVAGLCRAWRVPLRTERLARAPADEAEARRARYRFLRRAAREAGADWIVTAHHADDQAETVLFRVLRGTGVAGLAGIPERTRGGLLRPLLPFWRDEVEAYARGAGLAWRLDPSNQSLSIARNWIRHALLPEAERRIAPGARRNLVSLAHLAREAETGWRAPVRAALREVARREGAGFVLARSRLRGYDSAVGTRLLRTLLRRLGVVPGRTGTRSALTFITGAPSGREMHLPSGVRIRVEFDEARLERAAPSPPDRPVEIAGPEWALEDEALRLGGRAYRVAAGMRRATDAMRAEDAWSVEIDADRARFPLRLRAWEPGDRVRTEGGTKTLKKLLLEERVPRSRRRQLPVLVDAAGEVLWVGGLRRATAPASPSGGRVLFLTIAHA